MPSIRKPVEEIVAIAAAAFVAGFARSLTHSIVTNHFNHDKES